MSLKIVRRIRDNLHGSIDVSELEDAVIAHPFVQRLRRVRQLAFLHYVFPGATHTRFEHSLGVMHLADVVWNKIKANQVRLRDAWHTNPEFAVQEQNLDGGSTHGRLDPTFALMDTIFSSDYANQAFRLAALLHDVGHPPFSHSGEHFMPSWREVYTANPNLPHYLREYLESKGCGDPDHQNASQKVRHEIYSILLIERILKQTYEKNPQLQPTIDPRDIIAIINPAISPDQASPLVGSHTLNLLRELISGELDIDRMDYLLRDSRECGVVYGVFDADRIFDSLSLYYDDNDKQVHVAINLSGLAAFEDYLRARYSMYLQLYFHKSSVAAEAMMWHLCARLKSWRLPATLENYAAIDEYNIGQALWEASQHLPADEKDATTVMVADLLYNRNLWKRVFEVSGTRGHLPTHALDMVRSLLIEWGVPFQEISSANSLTRFQPRDGSRRSTNYLRLIKKDEHQVPRVYPIEDYSQLIASNDSIVIVRIYAAPDETRGFNIRHIRAKLLEALQNTPAPS